MHLTNPKVGLAFLLPSLQALNSAGLVVGTCVHLLGVLGIECIGHEVV